MNYSVTFLEEHFGELVKAVFAEPELEGAAYLLCGVSRTPKEVGLLVRRVIPVRKEHYARREPLRLSIVSESYVPIAKEARALGEAILFVHSHPEGVPEFSRQDDLEEPKLLEFFGSRAPNLPHGAMVLSSADATVARIYDPHPVICSRVRVVGRRFRFLDGQNSAEAPIAPFFDRQVRAFGEDVQRLLSRLHAGVVGLGGTGSAVFEQLVRLGIGSVSIFDHDTFDTTNVNRVYGSSTSDAARHKVDIAADASKRIGVGTRIREFTRGINFESDARALRECDVIFCCTDKQGPRSILTQLSIRFLIPIIDMGVVIDSEAQVLRGVFGRVTTFFPGEACLFCRGRINPNTIHLEGLKPHERAALVAEGYAPELETNSPAVIPFTTAVAAQAVSELLHRLTGFMGSERRTTEIILKFHDSAVGRNRSPANPACLCSDRKLWGKGDTRRYLDLSWPAEATALPK